MFDADSDLDPVTGLPVPKPKLPPSPPKEPPAPPASNDSAVKQEPMDVDKEENNPFQVGNNMNGPCPITISLSLPLFLSLSLSLSAYLS